MRAIPGLVPLARYLRGDPPVSVSRREWLLEKIPRQSTGAEIGVYEGDFSARLLGAADPTTLHLIDPWEYDPEYEEAWFGGADGSQEDMDRRDNRVKQRFQSRIERGQVHVHRATSAEVSDSFEKDYFDWVYVDGNHQYEYVLQDLQLYYPKVRPGGLILGDDYKEGGWYEGGVKKAVDEFTDAQGLSLQTFGRQFLARKPNF